MILFNYKHVYHYRSEYFFKFDNQFEIHDDIDVLKRMGLLLGIYSWYCISSIRYSLRISISNLMFAFFLLFKV